MKENCSILNFPATRFVDNFIKILRNASRSLNMLKYWRLKMTETSYQLRFGFTDNQWENIWQGVRKSSKIGQDQKTLIFALIFANCRKFWPLLPKISFGGETGQKPFSPHNSVFFLFLSFCFSLFLIRVAFQNREAVVKQEGNFKRDFHFVLLIIDHHCTFAILLHGSIPESN